MEPIMTYAEAFRIAVISASVPAVVTVISVILDFLMNRNRGKKEIAYKTCIDSREAFKSDLAAYIGKIQQCYYDSFAVLSKKADYELASEHASQAVEYGNKIKFQLDKARYKELYDKINGINESCARFNFFEINKINLEELNNLCLVPLSAMDAEIKKLAGK
jgi:hypothetical protein